MKFLISIPILFIYCFSFAQKQDSTVQFIPIVEIPQNLEVAISTSKEVESLVILPETITEIVEKASKQRERIESKYNSLNDSSEYFSLSKLESELREWNTILQTLDQQNDQLATYIENLRKKSRKIDLELEKWDLTNAFVRQEEAPYEIVSMVQNAKSTLNSSKKSLQKAQSDALKIQALLAPFFTLANEGIRVIEERKNTRLNNIWLKDSPYIWHMKFDSTDIGVIAHVKLTTKNYATSFSNYLGNNGDFILTFALFFLSCLSYLIFLKINQKTIIKKYHQQDELNLLVRFPLSASLILTLTFTTLIHDIPESVIRVYSLVVLMVFLDYRFLINL
jgi:hypothetical protein